MKKSSVEGKEKPSLEDIFRNGFDGAESVPPTKIWENLDRELENQELKRYRSQVFWYRSVAAACLLLLFSASLFYWSGSDSVSASQEIVANSAVLSPSNVEGDGNLASNTDQMVANADKAASATLGPDGNEKFAQKEEIGRTMRKRPAQNKFSPSTFNAVQKMAIAMTSVEPEQVAQTSYLGEAGKKIEEVTKEPQSTSFQLPKAENWKSSSLGKGNTPALAINQLDTAANLLPESILVRKGSESQKGPQAAEVKSETELKVSSKWSLSLEYAPQYAYSPLRIGESNSAVASSNGLNYHDQVYKEYKEAVDEHNQSYTPGYSYAARVGASYSINDKWHLESGLLFAENVASTNHSYVVNSSSTGNRFMDAFAVFKADMIVNQIMQPQSSSVASVSKAEPYTTQYRYQQLGIPVKVGYRHNMRNLFAYASSGFSLNMLLKNSILPQSSRLEGVHYKFGDEDSPFEDWQCFSVTSLGIGYDFSQKVSIIVAPELTYALTPFLKESQNQTDAFQLGLSVGTKWRLYK